MLSLSFPSLPLSPFPSSSLCLHVYVRMHIRVCMCTTSHRKTATLFFDGFRNAAYSPNNWFLFIDPWVRTNHSESKLSPSWNRRKNVAIFRWLAGCTRRCVCACVRACVHACVRACVRACVCVCARAYLHNWKVFIKMKQV